MSNNYLDNIEFEHDFGDYPRDPASEFHQPFDPEEQRREWQDVTSTKAQPAKSRAANKAISLVDGVIELISKKVVFYKDQSNLAYALLETERRSDVHYLDDPAFADLVARMTYEDSRQLLNENQLKQICSHLSAIARFEAQTLPVYVRSFTDAERDTYIQIGNDNGDVIKVTAKGWTLISERECPVLFWRTALQKPLVLPQRGGGLDLIESYANFENPDMIYLFVTLLAFYLEGMGPFPICVLNGQPGAGKSELASMVKELVDNSIVNSLLLPRNLDDYIVSQRLSKISVYDNVEHLTPEQSNMFCVSVTNGASIKRKLYSNNAVTVSHITSATIFTTIHALIERDDAADRSIPFALNRLGDGKFIPKKVLLERRAKDLPLIFGAVLDLLCAIKAEMAKGAALVYDTRLVDFATFGTAAEKYLEMETGEFVRLIQQSQRAFAPGLKSKYQAFYKAICDYMAELSQDWKGGAGALLQAVTPYKDAKAKNWPESSEAAGRQLSALQKTFEMAGINAYRDTSGGRNWVFKLSEEFIEEVERNRAELAKTGETMSPASMTPKQKNKLSDKELSERNARLRATLKKPRTEVMRNAFGELVPVPKVIRENKSRLSENWREIIYKDIPKTDENRAGHGEEE